MTIPSRCCCSCTVYSDNFVRSGAGLDPDGVNPTGVPRYTFTAGDWAVVSNKLQCNTGGSPITLYSGNAYASISGQLQGVGDFVTLSNGIETASITLENYTYAGTTKVRAKVDFHGYTNHIYGGSGMSSSLSLPYVFTNLDLLMMDCSKSWNTGTCNAVVKTNPDLCFCSRAIRVGQGDYFTGTVYTWTVTASAGTKITAATVLRNGINKNCATRTETCTQVCGGDWPGSIQLTISGFSDGKGRCVENWDDYSACQNACTEARDTALGEALAARNDYQSHHGGVDPPNYCDIIQGIKEDFKDCDCACKAAAWTCITKCPCTLFNGTFTLDRNDFAQGELGSSCGYYECYLPVPDWVDVNFTNCSESTPETDWFTQIHVIVSYARATGFHFQVALPFFFGTFFYDYFSTSVPKETWCEGGTLIATTDLGTMYMDGITPTFWRMIPATDSPNIFGTTENTHFVTCGGDDPITCGGSDYEECDLIVGWDGVYPAGEAIYADPLPELETTVDTVMQCVGSAHTPPQFSLESGGV